MKGLQALSLQCVAVLISSCSCVHQHSAASCLCWQSATIQSYLIEQCMYQGLPHSCCNPTPEQAPHSNLPESCICTLHFHCSMGIRCDIQYAYWALPPICAKCRLSIDGIPSGLVCCKSDVLWKQTLLSISVMIPFA